MIMARRTALLLLLLVASFVKAYVQEGDEMLCDVREHVLNHSTSSLSFCPLEMWDEFDPFKEEDDTFVYAKHLNHYSIKENTVDVLRFEDGSIIDPFAVRVGLPPFLISTMQEFAADFGIFNLLHNILYKDSCQSDRGRFYKSQFQRNQHAQSQNLLWAVQRPSEDFKSDIHWLLCSCR
jgi:hypothetical protein